MTSATAAAHRAQELFVHGAKIVVDNVPLGTEIGIDFKSWRTGDRFRGIKMIPPGLHMLYYAAIDKAGQPTMRTGMFLQLQARQVCHLVWSREREELDIATTQIFTDRTLLELEPSMGAYPLDEVHGVWQAMSRHITSKVVEAILPPSGKVSGLPAAPAAPANAVDNSMRRRGPDEPRWTEFDLRRSFPAGAPADQITRLSLDKSWQLEHQVDRLDRLESVVGEFQLAFVCFLVLQMYDAFEQWKSLFILFCSCTELLQRKPELFITFISAAKTHVELTPDDIFPPDVLPDNFISNSVQRLKRSVDESGSYTQHPRLLEACTDLAVLVERRFGSLARPAQCVPRQMMMDDGQMQQIDTDDEDDAPVIVQL